MTFQQELASWNPFNSGPGHTIAAAPSTGSSAPSAGALKLPRADGKAVVVAFLRHCGCPFAEKVFRRLRAAADAHGDVAFVAVTHSDEAATQAWLDSVGGKGAVDVLVDHDREIYAAWGLGASSFWHVLNPAALVNVYNLGKQEGIWNKPTQSGSRWQTAGNFAIDRAGTVRWARVNERADEMPDFEEAVVAVKS